MPVALAGSPAIETPDQKADLRRPQKSSPGIGALPNTLSCLEDYS